VTSQNTLSGSLQPRSRERRYEDLIREDSTSSNGKDGIHTDGIHTYNRGEVRGREGSGYEDPIREDSTYSNGKDGIHTDGIHTYNRGEARGREGSGASRCTRRVTHVFI